MLNTSAIQRVLWRIGEPERKEREQIKISHGKEKKEKKETLRRGRDKGTKWDRNYRGIADEKCNYCKKFHKLAAVFSATSTGVFIFAHPGRITSCFHAAAASPHLPPRRVHKETVARNFLRMLLKVIFHRLYVQI